MGTGALPQGDLNIDLPLIGEPLRITYFSFAVGDIIKDNTYLVTIGEPIEVNLVGGDKEFGSYILRTTIPGLEPLMPGHDYVVFLRRGPINEMLMLTWGPAGLYDVTNEQMKPVAPWQVFSTGSSASQFLAEVRNAVR